MIARPTATDVQPAKPIVTWFGRLTPAWLFWAGMFLLLLAARLLLASQIASPLPFWDEWDPDLIALFLPPLRGTPDPGLIFAYHNEHLIALTRLYDLALFWIENRHWHILPETIINQVYYCAFAVALTAALCRRLAGIATIVMAIAATILFANPFGWEAVSWAFDSQMYLCIVLSVASLWLLAENSPDSPVFWCGVAASLLSVLAWGTGMVTLVVAMMLVCVRQFGGRHRRAAALAAIVLSVALVAILLTTPYGNDMHRRLDPVELASACLKILSWPCGPQTLALVQWPAMLLLLTGLAGWRSRDRLFWFAAAIVVWQSLVTLQLAISRPAAPVTPRYTELLIIGIAVNLACALHLAAELPRRIAALCAAGLWLALLALGFSFHCPRMIADLANKRYQDDAQEFSVARFLKTSDMAYILPPAIIPYHTPAMLAARLTQGRAAGIFSPALLDGDTPRRDKWRSRLSRFAAVLACAGAAAMLAGSMDLRRKWRRQPPEPASAAR